MLNVTLFSKTGFSLETVATSVKLPSTIGEMEILQSHAPYVGLLDAGIITINDNAGKNYQFVCDQGAVQVADNRLMIVVNAIKELFSIDAKQVDAELTALEAKLSGGDVTSDDDRNSLYAQIRYYQAQKTLITAK